MLDRGFPMPKFAEREHNFFNGELPSTVEGKMRYMELQWLADNNITPAVNKMQGIYTDAEILQAVFTHVYDFVMAQDDSYQIFDGKVSLDRDRNSSESSLSSNSFEACFFMSLCMFLYDTRRIKGKSLREFTYENSLLEYNVKGLPNYFDYHERPKEFRESNSGKPDVSSDLILSEEAKLRQYRKRLLDKRSVYQHSTEWSAIRKVSGHEWALYFSMGKADDEIQDTEKRIRNLYNDVNSALASEMDGSYSERLDGAAKKFCSKLQKLQYKRYLRLIKYAFEHINRDKTCYGINLYRLEKELKPYRITSDVNRLVNCDNEEADRIMLRAMRMGDIVFPRLYEYFSKLPDAELYYANIFLLFMDEVVQSTRLILDKFVEDGVFCNDWEGLFLETTNRLADAVFYDPSTINFSLAPRSQEEFQIYLLEPVDRRITYHKSLHICERYSISKFLESEIDDDDI